MQTNKLTLYLESKYKDRNDFVIIGFNIYSKTSVSFKTLLGIDEIQNIKAVYYLSDDCKPFKLGFKIGIALSDKHNP